MKSIHLQSTLFPCHSQHRKQLSTPNEALPCFSSNIETPKKLKASPVPASARDIALALASPQTKSPEEVAAFVAVSTGLFFMYWVANFVAPDLISKQFKFDKDEDETGDE